MAEINLSAIRDLLLPGIHTVYGEYKQIKPQWQRVFTKQNSDMATERMVEVRLLGLAQLRDEGTSTYYDNNAGERNVYSFTQKGIGLGYIITRNAIKDNQYKSQFLPNTRALANSFGQTKEILCANILNNGTTYDSTIGGDGVALFSTAHPIDGGTVANRPTVDLELNETSLQDAITAIRFFKDAAGLRYLSKVTDLVVPPSLEFTAVRLLRTEGRVGTADNDINAIKDLGFFGSDPVIMDFLTSTKSWFVKTDAPAGLTVFEREELEFDMMPDFDTDNLKVKGYERYTPGYGNWRTAYGNFPT